MSEATRKFFAKHRTPAKLAAIAQAVRRTREILATVATVNGVPTAHIGGRRIPVALRAC